MYNYIYIQVCTTVQYIFIDTHTVYVVLCDVMQCDVMGCDVMQCNCAMHVYTVYIYTYTYTHTYKDLMIYMNDIYIYICIYTTYVRKRGYCIFLWWCQTPFRNLCDSVEWEMGRSGKTRDRRPERVARFHSSSHLCECLCFMLCPRISAE